jgi:hypothetical protein
LESLRKYGFGALVITGESSEQAPFDIWGVFLVRGKTRPAELAECPDSEYYTWTQLDTSSDKGKQRFAELLDAEKVEGKPVLERRYFK